MKIKRIHVSDAPFAPSDGEVVDSVHFIGTGSTYGRYLFTDTTLVYCTASNVTFRDCMFEAYGTKISWYDQMRANIAYARHIGSIFPPSLLFLVLRLQWRWTLQRYGLLR